MIKTSDFLAKWKNYQNKPIFLACSGGVDSVVLLHLLKAINFQVSVLHVNYQLRGEDSEGDEKWLTETCHRLNVPMEVRKVDTLKLLENGGNLQEITRKIRYTWFQEILDQNPSAAIALAHHQNDQVETFFQHIARKSGVLGMACMLEVHGDFIRPLLAYSKTEILDFAAENKISWREDVSNSQSKYSRNKLRNLLLPEIQKAVPNITESVLTLIQAFQQTQAELELKAEKTIRKIRETQKWDFEDYDKTEEDIQVEILRQIGIRASVLPEIEKLRKTQKGRKITIDQKEIWKENSHFGIYPMAAFEIPSLEINEISEIPKSFSKDIIYLDKSKIKGDLHLRKWENGDSIQAIGVNGSTLIAKVLTGAKISSRDKENALVLCDDVQVLWVVGIKISRVGIANGESKEILEVKIK